MNQKMRDLWDLPDSVQTGAQAIEAIIEKVDNSQTYLDRVTKVLADVDVECHEDIKLKNGKIYHRISKPLMIEGQNVGRSWTFQDITHSFHAEQTLRENEQKYRELYDHAEHTNKKLNLINRIRNSAIESQDLTKLIQNLVRGLAETFGYAVVGFYMLKGDVLHLIDSFGFEGQNFQTMTLDQGIIGRTARTQKPIFVEDVNFDPDYLSYSPDITSEVCVPVFDRNDLFGILNIESKANKLSKTDLDFISGLCGQVGEIISRVRLYTDVITKEEQLQRIFNFSPIGVVICALDGSFLETNEAFEKLIGYRIEELRSMKFIDITHPDEVDNNLSWTNRLVAGEIDTYGFEKRYIHKNGSFLNVFLQVSILPTKTPEPNQLIAQVIDVTPLKQAEIALMEHQKLESIGVLAGGIAHDFNNLLVALKAQSSLALIKLPSDSPAKEHIEKTKHAADSAAQLTTQLLAYSGQGHFKIEQTDLNLEVRQNSQLLTVAIPKNVSVHQNLDQDLPKIMADGGQLQQILMNLIINGAESMNGEPGNITITTSQTELSAEQIYSSAFTLVPPAPGPFIELSIVDDGMGMDDETLGKIFDPFFTTKFTGRGLGLAAVLGIVRSHNGALAVSSQIDVGTSFRIFFPVAAIQNDSKVPDPEPAKESPQISENRIQPAPAGGTVLLIDDDSMVRETIEDLFQLEDIPIISAADGTQGIEQLQTRLADISVVLLDLSMPGISSEETFTELRKLNPELPILLCSGFSELKVNEFFAKHSHEGFIAKPFDIGTLINKVREFI